MNNLDKLIEENRAEFDGIEPLDGHFERFRERLGTGDESGRTSFSRFSLLKVAAVILVIITGSIAVFDLATRSIREKFSAENSDVLLSPEFNDAIQYYDARALAQMKEVRKLTSDPLQADQINGDALKEMKALDESTSDLKKSLAENPNCERLQAAVIQNQQMKEGIMNNIVSKLNKH
ncbi:MAG: hypothetical protein NTU51_04620 [Bacteroidetes bacterium]|nr:hypothetical protein [Bacteroidota bacterium]